MKNVLKFSLILAITIFTFSCSNDNTDVIPEEQATETNAALKTGLTAYARNAVSSDHADDVFDNGNEDPSGDCFTINFPYSFEGNGVTVVINNQAELDAYMQSQNTPAGMQGTLVFPVTITLEDGSEVVINDEMEFIAVIEDCIGDDIVVGNDCFEFIFPLDVLTDDGNTVTVTSNLELFSIPNGVGFSYPITVATSTGVIVTINDDAGFDAIYNECYDIEPCDDCGSNCFEIVYPITLVDDSGNVVTVNDDEEFFTYIDGLGAAVSFVPTYPMNIEYEDGTQATINSDDELTAALDACN
ncbi:hypothetical protein [uncultured Kordia sp.]|uniref:hypothetical protein n=1 Tax=uncultured Kordia sp. TaxID=507699 RepID=UPI002622EB49|nr:hypothetical protein [uncultured Kordia sp.]